MRNYRHLYIFILLVSGIIVSIQCGEIYSSKNWTLDKVKILPKKNPTSWVFRTSLPLSKLKSCFKNSYSYGLNVKLNGKSPDMYCDFNGQEYYSSKIGKKIFRFPKNKNDIIFYNRDSIWDSKIYFDDNKVGMKYYAEFHVHFTRVGTKKIKVEILTHDPKILTDRTHFSHWGSTEYKKVEPSTIEEYLILLKIGKCLKAENMPELILPGNKKAKIEFY